MRKQHGFTMIELIIVIAVLAILGGSLLPTAIMMLDLQKETSTDDVMIEIEGAVRAYYEDYGAFPGNGVSPASLTTLMRPVGRPPYLVATTDTQVTTDKWGTAFQTVNRTNYLEIRSAGPNKFLGDGDDLLRYANIQDIRRKRTQKILDTLNNALVIYRETYQGTTPAYPNLNIYTGNWNQALTYLNTAALLPAKVWPSGTNYTVDAWGRTYVFDGVQVASLFR